MSPSFSISVPIGAYHPLLPECLKSLAIQTPRPAVALLDASGDPRVKEIADAFSNLIVYRRHGPDAGQSDAIIEGWKNAPGDILGWLNADDALYPDALKHAAAAFAEEPETDIAYGHSVIIDDDFAVAGFHWAVEPPSEMLLSGDIISQPSCFFRRSAYEKVGGLNAGLHYTMDWDLWVRLWKDGAKFAFIDEVMSRVLWTREAKTGGFGAARREELDRIINENGSPLRRLKSKAGFALHHVFEYMAPPALARPLRRLLSSSGAEISGLGRNGEIREKAIIPLVHYKDAPVNAIAAEFEAVKDATLYAKGAEAVACNKSAKLDLSAPWPPGETLVLTISNKASSPALLSRLHLA